MLCRLHVPLRRPEDVIPHLAKQERHWKAGYSAMELACSWGKAQGLPAAVREVLAGCPHYAGAELIDGFFEREVDLGTPGRNSQTDLMVVLGIGDELAIMAVEGKAEESFGELVAEWLRTDEQGGKARRLARLCETLCLDPKSVSALRYQLLHRTASAIYEARRYRARHAVMLVHSFSAASSWFDDFTAFSAAMGTAVSSPGEVSDNCTCEGVSLRLAWLADRPSTLPAV